MQPDDIMLIFLIIFSIVSFIVLSLISRQVVHSKWIDSRASIMLIALIILIITLLLLALVSYLLYIKTL